MHLSHGPVNIEGFILMLELFKIMTMTSMNYAAIFFKYSKDVTVLFCDIHSVIRESLFQEG